MIVIAVDDEALALKSLSDTIKKIRPDAEIYLFRDPLMALQSLESGVVKPDVIFSDIQMYDMTGIQFAHRIKVIYPHTNIVFVTGYSEYMMDAIRLHASGYLLKPISHRKKSNYSYYMI